VPAPCVVVLSVNASVDKIHAPHSAAQTFIVLPKKTALQFLLDVEISAPGDCSTHTTMHCRFKRHSMCWPDLHTTAFSFN
jgi:hypothetical protein